jgi:hypothetical protein
VDFEGAVAEAAAAVVGFAGADTAAGAAVVAVVFVSAGGGYGTRLWFIFFTSRWASLSQSSWHSLRLHSAQNNVARVE